MATNTLEESVSNRAQSFQPVSRGVRAVLFECNENYALRAKIWDNLLECCPDALKQQLQHMSSSEKTLLILTGLSNCVVTEWIPWYRSFVNSICKIYITRVNCS